MTVHPHEFIRRFLIHVLPKGLHRIRHYGLLANGQREANLAKARALLRVKTIDPADDNLRRADSDDTADTSAVLPRPLCCRARCAAATVPLLRRPHAHHRDLRRRLPATAARASVECDDEDRHVMSAAAHVDQHIIDHCYRWSRAGRDSACLNHVRTGRQISPQQLSDVMIADAIGLRMRIVSPGLLNRYASRRRSASAAPATTTESP